MLAILAGTKDQWRSLECTVGCYPWRESPLFRGPFPRLVQLTWKDTTTFEGANDGPQDITHHPPSQLLALVLSEAPAMDKISISQTTVNRWFGFAAFKRHSAFDTWNIRFEGTLANLRTLHLTKVEPPGRFHRPLCAVNLETLILHEGWASILLYFITPSLRHLTISNVRNLCLVLPSFWTASHHRCERPPSLLSLRLKHQDIWAEPLLIVLRSSPGLERLHLVHCTLWGEQEALFSRIEEEELCLSLTEVDFRRLLRPVGGDDVRSELYRFLEVRTNLPDRAPLRRALYSRSGFHEPVRDLMQVPKAREKSEPIL